MKTNLTIIFIIPLFMSLLIGCAKPQASNEQTPVNNQAAQDSSIEPSPASLAFWLRDSLANVDPQMTLLLDPIYQHDWPIYTDYYEYSKIGQEIGWVNEQKDVILQAYHMENASDKAQLQFLLTYIDTACFTWHVYEMTGTMRDHVNASIGEQFATYQTYLCLQHIYSAYDEGSILHLMSREFCGLELFTDALKDFVRMILYLQYFHGTLAGYMSSVLSCDIDRAKYNLYKDEVLNPYLCVSIKDESSVEDCILLLRQRCTMALNDVSNDSIIRLYEEELPESAEEYKAQIIKAFKQRDLVFQRIDEISFFAYREERTELWDSHRAFKQANDSRLMALLLDLTSIVNATIDDF